VLYYKTRGRGLGPGPRPFQNQTTIQLKYINPRLSNKEQAWVYWLADYFKGVGYGGGPGVEPRGLPKSFYTYIQHITNSKVTRGANGLGHVSEPYSLQMTRVNITLGNHHPIQTHHIINVPRQQDGTALHVAVRTVRTGTVSIPIFYLFDLAVKSRYLLHTDSIRENKYTAGIRKTRRTQWHCFRLNPSTLKIEQILIP
jgi:hypothetical protein